MEAAAAAAVQVNPVTPVVPAQPLSVGVGQTQYAGFWMRVAASLIDGFVLMIPGLIVIGIFGGIGAAIESEGLVLMGYLIYILMFWLYSALMEASSKQATVGKMALGLKVTDLSGGSISFGQATGRHFGKIVSYLILYIGYMMAGWTEKKQALHDMMASTLVVRK